MSHLRILEIWKIRKFYKMLNHLAVLIQYLFNVTASIYEDFIPIISFQRAMQINANIRIL